MVFEFNNLPEAEPEEEEPNAPAPPAQAERQRVYQLMKESTFQSLRIKGVPVQLSEQPSQRGYVTVYMDLTPEQRRQLEAGWSGMRTSPTFSKNLSSLASANRGRGYGSGYGGGGQRNRSRSRERRPAENDRGTRNRNRNRNRNENRNRTRNLRNRERAEQNANRLGHGSVLPDANDDQLSALLSALRF